MASDARQTSRVAPGRSSSRRCRRGSQPISPRSHSPTLPCLRLVRRILILASATNQAGGAFIPPSNKGLRPGDPAARTAAGDYYRPASTARRPARLRWLSSRRRNHDDDSELLARAAALTAPLPPMPIAIIGATAAAPARTMAAADASPVAAAAAWMGRSDGGARRRRPRRIVRRRLQDAPSRLMQAPTECGLRSNRLKAALS